MQIKTKVKSFSVIQAPGRVKELLYFNLLKNNKEMLYDQVKVI